MIGKPSREQLDRDVRQLSKDLKKLGEEIDIIGKRGKLGKGMNPDDLNTLLIKDDRLFELSPPLGNYDIKEIEDLVNNIHMKVSRK